MTEKRFVRTLARLAAMGVVLGVTFAGGAAYANHQFADVPNNSPFHADVDWLVGHGIASGFPDQTFRPQDPVKRQQMARFLRNYNNQIEIVTDTHNPPPGTVFHAFPECDAGQHAVAGGGTTDIAAGLFMTDSYPLGDTAWDIRWESGVGTVDPGLITGYALCVPDDSGG